MEDRRVNISVDVITGPTASGKSSEALRRAALDSSIEIVNADAFQIYRGFDIGTAKPTADIRSHIPHHLIDILEPSERYDAVRYSKDARSIIEDIIQHRKTPLVVGGTGLYIDALFFGISSITYDEEKLAQAYDRYSSEFDELGFDEMLARLKIFDTVLFEQCARERNPLRLERAFVHYYATGDPLGKLREAKPEPFRYTPRFTLLDPPREELLHLIERRVDTMLAEGWLDEVRRLSANGITRDMPAMRAIGYNELFDVLDGKIPLHDAREKIIIRTRQYAKRQRTWIKRYKNN